MITSLFTITLGEPLSINATAVAKCFEALKELSSLPSHMQGMIIGHHGIFCEQLEQASQNGLISDDVAKKLSSLPLLYEKHVFSLQNHPWCFLHTGPNEYSNTRKLTVKQRGVVASKALKSLKAIGEYCDRTHTLLSVITSPINKAAMHEAGFPFSGHTEYFMDMWQGEESGIMILYGERLKVGLLTHHIPLKAVSAAISKELIEKKVMAFVRGLRSIDIQNHNTHIRIALCTLNPHGSDEGLCGDEEKTIYAPAIKALKAQEKPENFSLALLSADTAFYYAYKGEYHGVLAAYHDQGLAPLKTVHFDTAVNITAGIKHFRLSPDHGPASDLYMRSNASFHSFLNCCKLALSYHNERMF